MKDNNFENENLEQNEEKDILNNSYDEEKTNDNVLEENKKINKEENKHEKDEVKKEEQLKEEQLEDEEELEKAKKEMKEKFQEVFKNKASKDNKPFKFKFSLKGLLMLIFIIALVMYIPTIMSESKMGEPKEISYSQFIETINSGEIKLVEEKEGYVYGYKEVVEKQEMGNAFKARLITNRLGEDTTLREIITAHTVQIKSVPPQQLPFIVNLLLSWLPMLLLIGVWVFMLRGMNKGNGGGPQIFNMTKSKTKDNGEDIATVTFADVAGIDEAKQELQEVVEFLKEPEKFKSIGARIPKGVLLLGSPGTGKTLLAKAVAGEAKVPFFSMSGSEFVEMFVGVGASRVRDLFNKARKNAPCIVFIDEIDAVGRKRGTGSGGGNDEREQTLNQLLVEMDGFGTEETIIVLAATNRPDVLDRALKRPGRFDRQVTVDKPDLKGREEILKVHAKNKKFSSDIDFKTIAKKTAGLVGADLANILNEAAILAARAGRAEITMADLEEASEKVEMGPEKRSKVVAEIDKKITAYHEAGHAVVGFALGDENKVHKITIIPRGFAGGYTMSLPAEEKMFQSKKYLLNRMIGLYGGRAAEEIIFGEENITTGASNDIERATAIAQFIVTRVGMNSKFGPIMLDGTQEGDMFQRKYYSEQTGKEVDDEIRKIINETYQAAIKILRDNRDKLEKVTQVLLEKETIMGDEFEQIMLGKYEADEADIEKFENLDV